MSYHVRAVVGSERDVKAITSTDSLASLQSAIERAQVEHWRRIRRLCNPHVRAMAWQQHLRVMAGLEARKRAVMA